MRNKIARAYYARCRDIYRFAETDQDQYLYEAHVRALKAIRRRHSKKLLTRHLHQIRPILQRIQEKAFDNA